MKDLIKKYYNEHKETIHNFTWRSLQIFGKQGITFLIFILCAKFLTPYDFGIYNYALATIFFLVMFGDFGISTATSKYVAEYNITDKNKLRAVFFNSALIISVLTLIITILAFTFGPWYLKDNYTYVLYLLPLIFLAPITSLYDGIYRGLRRFRQLAIISIVSGMISIPIVFILVKSHGLVGAIVSQNIFYLLLLLGLGFGYRDFDFNINKSVIRDISKYSIYLGVSIVGYYLFSRVDILILGHFGYISEIATYEVLNKLFLICLMPMQIFAQVIFPNFAEYIATKQFSKIINKFKKYAVVSGILALSFVAVSYVCTPFIVKTFFANYDNEIFYSLLIPVTLIYAIQVYGVILHVGIISPTGYAKLMTYLNLILGPLNLMIGIYLVPKIGFMGVIYSNLALNLAGTIILQSTYILKINRISKNQQ